MALYAKVRNSDNSVVEQRNIENFDAVAVSHKFGPEHEFRIIPVNRLADPVYDSATQSLGADQVTVLPDEVTLQRSIEAKTQDQIDRETEVDQAKAAYNSLMDDSATATQVKRILARVVRELFGQ